VVRMRMRHQNRIPVPQGLVAHESQHAFGEVLR
jgi:hypothetical protein